MEGRGLAIQKKSQAADRIILLFMIALAAVYLYATEQFPTMEISDPLGPKAFPRILGIGLILAAVGLLIEMIRGSKTEPNDTTGSAGQEQGMYWVVAAAVVWTALYFAVFERLGYAVATSIYLFLLMAYFHKGKWTANILTSVLYSFCSYLVFTKLLEVRLPRGILPF